MTDFLTWLRSLDMDRYAQVFADNDVDLETPLEAGETILLCRHNVPIAEIRPLPPQRTTPRPLGTAKGKVKVPPEFFEPLPEEILQAFEGQGT